MRKRLIVAALVAGSLSFGAFGGASADQLPGGIEGCVVTSPGAGGAVPANPTGAGLYTDTCSYVTTRTGGFVGGGQSWSVQVFDAANNKVGDFGGSGPACNTGAFTPGQRVVVTVSNGWIAAGNPVPTAANAPASGDQCP